MNKNNFGKKAMMAALAITIGSTTGINAADKDLSINELVDGSTLIACNESKCGDVFCASKKAKKFLRSAGAGKKLKKKSKSSHRKSSESKCGEVFCASKKTKSFLRSAGATK